MGFLEGLGRSRAITGTLSAIDQLKANEQARAINAQNLRMNEMEMVNQERAFQYQQQQLDAQAKEDAMEIDVKYSPFLMSLQPETREMITKGAMERGILNEQGRGQKGAWKRFLGEFEQEGKNIKIVSELEQKGMQRQLDQLIAEKAELQQKGDADPNKLKLKQDQINAMSARYMVSLNKTKEALEALQGQQQQTSINKIDASKYSPESVQEFSQTGDFSVLQPIMKETEPYKIGTIHDFNVNGRTVYKTYLGEGKWETMKDVGGPRYKEAIGGSRGGGISDKDKKTYEKNVTAYKREVASIYQEYDNAINQPEATGNSKSARILRGDIIKKRNKDIATVVKKYRGKIDFLQSTLSSSNVIKYDAQGRRIQ